MHGSPDVTNLLTSLKQNATLFAEEEKSHKSNCGMLEFKRVVRRPVCLDSAFSYNGLGDLPPDLCACFCGHSGNMRFQFIDYGLSQV